jgi:hypothetical protein
VLDFLKPAFQDAKKDLVKELTRQVRIYTQNQGWPAEIARSLSVKDNKTSFKISSYPSTKDQVFDLEHLGNENTAKGSLRKFGNMNTEFGRVFVVLFDSRVRRAKK